MRRRDGIITPPLTRCEGCGSWVWLIDKYGCRTCLLYWARHRVDPKPPKP